MDCAACGKDNPDDSRFCGTCGVSLSVSTASGIGTAASGLPRVSFPQAVSLGFKNYFKFSGRATRAEYWWWFLFTVLAVIGLAVVDGASDDLFDPSVMQIYARPKHGCSLRVGEQWVEFGC